MMGFACCLFLSIGGGSSLAVTARRSTYFSSAGCSLNSTHKPFLQLKTYQLAFIVKNFLKRFL
jgi:hypothetical protein